MIEHNEENDRTFVIDSAIINKLGTKEEIQLYENLNLALELMRNNDFEIVESKIDNGINFGISTKYPHGLPERVGTLFFNINTNYDVKIKETSKHVYLMERYFMIKIKKYINKN